MDIVRAVWQRPRVLRISLALLAGAACALAAEPPSRDPEFFEKRIRPVLSEEAEPENVLLHRMNVRRLEAEAIRDAILAVSGRLDPQLGGPSVPVHLTEFMEGRGKPKSDGAGRRSIFFPRSARQK